MDGFKTRKKKEKKSSDDNNLLAILTTTQDNADEFQDPTKPSTALLAVIDSTAEPPAAADQEENAEIVLNNIIDTAALLDAVAQKRRLKQQEQQGPTESTPADSGTGFKASLIQLKQQEAKAAYIQQQMVSAGVVDETTQTLPSAKTAAAIQRDVQQQEVLLRLAEKIPVRRGQKEGADDEQPGSGEAFTEVKLTITERQEMLAKTRDFTHKILQTKDVAQLEKMVGTDKGKSSDYGKNHNSHNSNHPSHDRERNRNYGGQWTSWLDCEEEGQCERILLKIVCGLCVDEAIGKECLSSVTNIINDDPHDKNKTATVVIVVVLETDSK